MITFEQASLLEMSGKAAEETEVSELYMGKLEQEVPHSQHSWER